MAIDHNVQYYGHMSRASTDVQPDRRDLAPSASAPPELNRASPVPLFLQIRQHLVAEILAWPDKRQRFPTEDVLAKRFSVSRMTVRQAVEDLVAAGWLTRTRGRGTFVTDVALAERLSPTLDIDADYRRAGHPQTVDILSATIRSANAAERAILDLRDDATVLDIRRLRHVAGVPVAVDDRVLESGLAVRAELDATTASGSIIDRLRRVAEPVRARWTLTARLAGTDLGALLCVGPTEPVLERSMLYIDANGKNLLAGRTIHRSDLSPCTVELPLLQGS